MSPSHSAAVEVPAPIPAKTGAWSFALPAVLLLATAVRIPLVMQPACIDRNGVQFVEFARQLSDHPIETMKATTRQPGFAALILVTHTLFNDWLGGNTPEAWQRCGEVLALVGGVATCGCVFLLAKAMFDPLIGLIAGILACLWPQGAEMSAEALSDMPHLALYLAALLCVLRAIRNGNRAMLFGAGVLAGLSYLIRQEAVGLLAAAVIGWWFDGPDRRLRRRITGAALLALGFAVAASPHSILTGRWIPNKNPLDLLRLIHPTSSGPATASLLLGYDVPAWRVPDRLVADWLRSGRVVLPMLFLVGAFSRFAPRAERRGRRLVAWAVVAQVLLLQARAAIYGELSSRYVAIPLALSLPWAASGWLTLIRRARPHRLAATAAIVVPILPLAFYLARPVYGGKAHYRTAGIWLREHADPHDQILAHENLEQALYYADRTYPATTWSKTVRADGVEQVAARIASDHPSWFVDAEDSHRDQLDEGPYFSSLRGGAIPALKLEKEFGPVGRRILIFRVESPK